MTIYLSSLGVIMLVSYFTVKGKCPSSVSDGSITTCDGSSKTGTLVYIDFNKINTSCTCSVTPSFIGMLLIKTAAVNVNSCATTITVEDTYSFNCPTPERSNGLSVIAAQPVMVIASYKSNESIGAFHHCLGFQQFPTGRNLSVLSVSCGVIQTTNEMTITPLTFSKHVSTDSMPASTSEITVSRTPHAQMDELSFKHLQILSVILAVTTVASVTFNICLIIKFKRNDGKTRQGEDKSREKNHGSDPQPAVGTYPELHMDPVTTSEENQVYAEIANITYENQYNSVI